MTKKNDAISTTMMGKKVTRGSVVNDDVDDDDVNSFIEKNKGLLRINTTTTTTTTITISLQIGGFHLKCGGRKSKTR